VFLQLIFVDVVVAQGWRTRQRGRPLLCNNHG